MQRAILAAINDAMSQREVLVDQIAAAMRMELTANPSGMGLSMIERRLTELEQEFRTLFDQVKGTTGYTEHAVEFKRINENIAALKEKKNLLLAERNQAAANRRVQDAVRILHTGCAAVTEWNESMIRQLVDTVKVLSKDRIRVYLRGGVEIEKTLDKQRD